MENGFANRMSNKSNGSGEEGAFVGLIQRRSRTLAWKVGFSKDVKKVGLSKVGERRGAGQKTCNMNG